MSVKSEVFEKNNYIMHTFSDVISAQSICDVIEGTIKHPQYRAGMNVVWYCDVGTSIEVKSEEIHKISAAAEKSFDQQGGNYNVALVAREDLAYGMNRAYEGWNNDRAVNIKVFRELDEALVWIKQS